jgi:hypothetical protein
MCRCDPVLFGERPDEAADLSRGAGIERLAKLDKGIAVRLLNADHELAVLGLLLSAIVIRQHLPSRRMSIGQIKDFVYTL